MLTLLSVLLVREDKQIARTLLGVAFDSTTGTNLKKLDL